MVKIGFILTSKGKKYIQEQQAILKNETINMLVFGGNETVDNLFDELQPKDVLVVSRAYDLQKTIVQLKDFVIKLKKNDVVLNVLKKSETNIEIDDRSYMELLIRLGEQDQEVASFRTKSGIKNCTKSGRPKIDSNIINKIKKMTKMKEYSIAEIAHMCEVSVGTVYKYRYIS